MTIDELLVRRQKQRCFYTKKETDEILLNTSLSVIVENLPDVGVEGYLYLIPTGEENVYTQYVWTNGDWESLGDKEDKLVNFVTELELNSAITDYCPIIEDARNGDSAAIDGIAPFDTLLKGLKILLHLKYYTPDNATLNLTLADNTTTGAKNIVYQADDGTALLVSISNTYGRYKSGLYVLMVYNGNKWVCATPVHKNTTYNTTTVAEVETGTNTTGKLVSPSTLNTLLQQKANTTTEVTWQELKDLRDNSQLVPGSLYRITDYQCTTTQENTQSAGHQFDIVLLALSNNKLAEEGWAMMHDNIYDITFSDGVTKKCYLYNRGYDAEYEDELINVVDVNTLLGGELGLGNFQIDDETKTAIVDENSSEFESEGFDYNYFQNSNLSAWKVWYCLDNDTDRFAWADDSVDEGIYTISDVWAVRDKTKDITGAFAWYSNEEEVTYFTNTPTPKVGDSAWVDGNSPFSIPAIKGFGRGVIYRLIDEWNNDCPYDFKNIQFVRSLDDGAYSEEGDNVSLYTFTIYDTGNAKYLDASIFSTYYMGSDGYCKNNCIKFNAPGYFDNSDQKGLNDVVFLTQVAEDEYGCEFENNVLSNVYQCILEGTIKDCEIICAVDSYFQNLYRVIVLRGSNVSYSDLSMTVVAQDKQVVMQDIEK